MQQASDAMREALKGDSAASAAISDMDVDAAIEMVYIFILHYGHGLFSSQSGECTQLINAALPLAASVC